MKRLVVLLLSSLLALGLAVPAFAQSTPAAPKIDPAPAEQPEQPAEAAGMLARALAIREELASLGIDPKRVHTISYGEDRPAVDGHNEDAWARNRRGEFVLLTPR